MADNARVTKIRFISIEIEADDDFALGRLVGEAASTLRRACTFGGDLTEETAVPGGKSKIIVRPK